jgi:hypothetical protein
MVLSGTLFVPSHTWSLPLRGPVQLPRSNSAQVLQGPSTETWFQADLRVRPWLRPSPMASSHNPAVLPRPMQFGLGRSVSPTSTPAC